MGVALFVATMGVVVVGLHHLRAGRMDPDWSLPADVNGVRPTWSAPTSANKQLPASFALLTTTITARVREPRRQL
jgi:hypothetical protein